MLHFLEFLFFGCASHSKVEDTDHFTYYLARITLYIVHHDDVRDNPFFPDGCAATSLVVPPETRGIDSCFLGK